MLYDNLLTEDWPTTCKKTWTVNYGKNNYNIYAYMECVMG